MLRKQTDQWFNPITPPQVGFKAIHAAILNIALPFFIVDVRGDPGICITGGILYNKNTEQNSGAFRVIAFVPPYHPQNLGNMEFKKRYDLKFAYLVGDMAQGISSTEMLRTAGNTGMLGFFGSAGIKFDDLEKTLLHLKFEFGNIPFGINLIHSPASPERELKLVNLFLKHKINLISASGFLRLSTPLIYYRLKGIYKRDDGTIICPNRIIAKASRIEVASLFLSPPPEKVVRQLLKQKLISQTEAGLAQSISMADDLTAEADSAGHTDNRPAISLLPSVVNLRDSLYRKFAYHRQPCVGLAGGIGTPMAVAAAFSMGADYILTGSINQACIESGTSEAVRRLLSEASQTDVTMAPSADMFERGIRVQVLKRGTMFSQHAGKLYELYRHYESLEQIPESLRKEIEHKILQRTFDEEWRDTRIFFEAYDPKQLIRAENDPKHKMALVFRSYLGQSSRWAISGDPFHKNDYQVWCGPSMGAFNEWVKGSFLEKIENRTVETVAMNLLFGACVCMRRQGIVNSGFFLPPEIGKPNPLHLSEIKNRL